jgi:tetratricopeptide (TPR) repeat protein
MAKCRSTRLIAMPMPRAFQEAYAAHQRGALAQAESGYQAVLAQQPRHPDCLHLLGVLRHQQGRHRDAAELIRRALAAQPELAGAWLNLGNVLKALGDPPAALDAYGQALALQPDFGAAHVNLANTLQALGRHAEAVAAYRQALSCEPHNAAILNNLGNALASTGDLPQAAAAFEAALVQAPTHAGALNNLGNTRKAMGETEQALAHFRAALALQPDFASAWFNLGHTLDALDRCAEAAPAFEQALALQPEWLQARYGLAHALAGMGQAAQARAHYEQVLRHDPGLAAAWQEMGCALYDMGEYEAAAHAFERALQARPDFALASFNRALIKLLQGDLRGGWPGYEARWQVHASAAGTAAIEPPRWNGATPLVGRTLLIHAEQGLGDTIQFVRYIPSVAKRAAQVILEVQPELHALLAPLAQSWGVQLIVQGQARPPFDCHCPLLSLPLAFNTTLATIPNPHPYLVPREADTIRWRASVAALRHPRIGIVWSGRVKARGEHRALPLAQLETLLARSDIDWVLLQKDTPASDRAAFERIAQLPNVHAPAYALENFADTAALIGELDCVLSIDTSVAHLAAALGKPTWIMLPYAPDWRWLLERTDSPWYAQVRLFRQGAPDAWDEVLAQVAQALDTLPPSWRHG